MVLFSRRPIATLVALQMKASEDQQKIIGSCSPNGLNPAGGLFLEFEVVYINALQKTVQICTQRI